MKTRSVFVPLSVAVLSLGFLGHSPVNPASKRHISSVCDPTAPTTLPAAPTNPFDLVSYFQTAAAQQSQNSFAFFQQQMALSRALLMINASSPNAPMRLPVFPSYALPTAADAQLAPPPQPKNLIFGGLNTNPDLQFLVKPAPVAEASDIFGGSLD